MCMWVSLYICLNVWYIYALQQKYEYEAGQASNYLEKIAELENQQQVCVCAVCVCVCCVYVGVSVYMFECMVYLYIDIKHEYDVAQASNYLEKIAELENQQQGCVCSVYVGVAVYMFECMVFYALK